MNGLEKRLLKLENCSAKKTEIPRVCSCRITTRFHNAACLEALLKGLPRNCPIHGFRELGSFLFTSSWRPLLQGDNEYCPCPPHPWRSFVLNGPHTWEAHYAAQKAWHNFDVGPKLTLEEENRRLEVVWDQFELERQQWYEKTDRQPPSKLEILKLGRQRLPKFTWH